MSESFEEQVIAKLSTLETHMQALIGNGQPGRISHLESKVRWHDRVIWIGLGGATIIGYLVRGFLGQ